MRLSTGMNGHGVVCYSQFILWYRYSKSNMLHEHKKYLNAKCSRTIYQIYSMIMFSMHNAPGALNKLCSWSNVNSKHALVFVGDYIRILLQINIRRKSHRSDLLHIAYTNPTSVYYILLSVDGPSIKSLRVI